MADAIPVRVGHYELVRTIGKGNFAVVKLGRHSVTNAKVAVKVIATRQLDTEQMRKLWREIDIMKRVSGHEHVVRLYQVMQSPHHVMLVTEFCAGGEIFDQLVQNGRMSESAAKDYFQQILKAVEYLHSRGIVHRDLKAENLLLSSDLKRVKLADFGFSNFFSQEQLLTTWCGSPPYAAPELFEGKRYSGPKADIWSLGVVLYVLVCGALPFDGHTLQALKTRVLGGKFRIPFFMSADCEHLIRHMLVVDPERRLSLPQVKGHRWMRDCVTSSPPCVSPSEDNDIDMSLIEWISRELSQDSLQVLESVTKRHFDHNYALYHLVKDSSHASPSSAPPSPPLLPLIPSSNQRKSSITTGVVERDTPSTLSAAPSPLRRHTFGPDAGGASSSQTQLVTPPLLFLTPPTAPPPLSNLPQAPPNYPIGTWTHMDLLRPPNVLLINNNMGRRASDGQANYSQSETHSSVREDSQTLTSLSVVNCAHSQSPPRNKSERRKRHSLTNTEELVGRQRRSGITSVTSPTSDRVRRRASDGSSARHVISISSLQTELRALCVSSPPSLTSSPQHSASPSTSAVASPSSPPPVLPLISEEMSHQRAGQSSPLLTPPQSFRSSPVSPVAPSIALTDECGLQFPILPPPASFTVVSSCDLQNSQKEDESVTSLARWRNDENRRQQFVAHAQLRQTFPPALSGPPAIHFRSLQTLTDDRKLTTTGSGSICVEDVSAATRLLTRFRDQTIGFLDSDLQICLEWSELRQSLVLRRVSGDQSQYSAICSQLIHSVM